MRSDGLTRRGFLSTSVAGAVGAGVFGFPGFVKNAIGKEKKDGEIIYRTLGRTGLSIPVVSMGVMNSNNPEVVQASYELGVRYFDTAANYQYGRNEMMVGNVIKSLGVRDKVVIATKELRPSQSGETSPEDTTNKLIKLCEGSLSRLKTDYIDILYFHSVSSKAEVNDPGMIEGFTRLKKEGKIRFTGISTHQNMAEVINAIAEGGFYDVVLTSFNVALADDVDLHNAVENAAARGVGIVAMKTQMGGQRLATTAASRNFDGSTIMKASLKWVLNNRNVATSIPGYDNFAHMNEDFSVASNLEYTDDEKSFLNGNNITLGMGYCRQCRECVPGCPKAVDIPTLMRVHMYAASYGNPVHAKITLDDIPQGKSIGVCSNCPECRAQCVRGVTIPENIAELKSIYA